MYVRKGAVRIAALSVMALLPLAGSKSGKSTVATGTPVLWRDPGADLNLYYGAGGRDREPRGPFTFIKEDERGSSPKYTVRDAAGVKWKIKLGLEARPETAASRLVWAAGYFANEDYLVPSCVSTGFPRTSNVIS